MVLAVGALLLAGCAGGQRDESSYTSKVKENFTGQCWVQLVVDANQKIAIDTNDSLSDREDLLAGKAPKAQVAAAKKYCTCVYSALKKNVKFGEFKKVNEKLREDGGDLPASFTKAYSSCEVPAELT